MISSRGSGDIPGTAVAPTVHAEGDRSESPELHFDEDFLGFSYGFRPGRGRSHRSRPTRSVLSSTCFGAVILLACSMMIAAGARSHPVIGTGSAWSGFLEPRSMATLMSR